MMEKTALVAEVIDVQERLRLGDREMAKRLGISHSYWLALRSGRRQPGRKFVVSVLRVLPILEPEVIQCLKQM